MILLGLMSIWAIIVLATMYVYKSDICSDGIWSLFWTGVVFVVTGSMVQGCLAPVDPNNWKVLCMKRGDYIQAYTLEGSARTHEKCVSKKDIEKQE